MMEKEEDIEIFCASSQLLFPVRFVKALCFVRALERNKDVYLIWKEEKQGIVDQNSKNT